MKYFSLTIIVLVLLFSINKTSCQTALPNVFYSSNLHGKAYLFIDGDSIEFNSRISEYKYHAFECFTMDSDRIIFSETNYIYQNRYKKYKSSYLFLSTLKKEILDTLYQAKEGERIVGCYKVNSNDSLLLISLGADNYLNRDSCKVSSCNFLVFDFKNHNEIKRFNLLTEPHGILPNGSIISPVFKHFVFTGLCPFPCVSDSILCGVNIIDLQNLEIKQISENGRKAVWSPNNDFIAYSNKEGVWLYDIQTGDHKLFYKIKKKKQRVVEIDWTPDGKSLFFQIRTLKALNHGGIIKPYLKNIITGELMVGGELYKYGIIFKWK
jgi:WD40 repeat protein